MAEFPTVAKWLEWLTNTAEYICCQLVGTVTYEVKPYKVQFTRQTEYEKGGSVMIVKYEILNKNCLMKKMVCLN